MNLTHDSVNKMVIGQTDYDLDKDTLKKVILGSVEFARQNLCTKILFDHRESVLEASIIELFNITTELSRFGMTPEFQCAVIYTTEGDKYVFSEKVINNRINPQVRFFDNFDKGKTWLLKEHP